MLSIAIRMSNMETEKAAEFYEWCIGPDWQGIVEKDTNSLIRLIDLDKPLFVRAVKELQISVLLTGSKKDQMVRMNLEEEYSVMAREIPNAGIHLFNE